MNYLINEVYINAQHRQARRSQMFGMLLVIASFVGSLFLVDYPFLVFFSYPALILGFPMWMSGRGRARRWSEEAKVSVAVAGELKGVSTRHSLFAYPRLPDGTVLDYLIVAPDGFYVVEMKQGGFPVSCRQNNGRDRWSERLPLLERLARLGEESLGNPTVALDAQIASLRKWLTDNKLAEPEVPVYGVVVFREPRTTLDVGDSAYEALRLDELKSFVMTPLPEDEEQPGARLPTDDRNRTIGALRELMGAPAVPAAKSSVPAARGGSTPSGRGPSQPARTRPGDAAPPKRGTTTTRKS